MPCFVDFAADLILLACIFNLSCFSSCLDEDALVFDAVLALGSTLKAAELLGIPQSSISRRYRGHASSIHVEVDRTADGYQITKGQFIVERFRRFAVSFRAFNQLNRFAIHATLLPFFSPKSTELPGCLLRLPQSKWKQWLSQEILDSVLDCRIIGEPVVVGGSAQVSPAMVVEIVHPPALSVPRKSLAKRVYLGDLALINGLPQAVESFGWEAVAFKHPDHALAILRPQRCSKSLPFDSLATNSQFNMVSTNRPPAGGDNLPITQQQKAPTSTKQSAFPFIPPTWQLDPNVEVLVGLVWTHSAFLKSEDLIVLRKLSEFEFAIQSYIDSKVCSICSHYAVDCPNAH